MADFATDSGLWRTAAATSLLVAAILLAWSGPDLARGLGDPDDALRLSMVRDLLHGRGWYDQRIVRLQPPIGTVMHWSRLVDGGLAAIDAVFSLVLGPHRGELWARAVWPLVWILPALWAGLVLARRLAGPHLAGAAVLAAALVFGLDPMLYGQFLPGRIDHHNVQIALCLVALAGATVRAGTGGPLLAGLATGLGLAVGIEALPFEAAIGAGLALRLAFDAAGSAPAAAYGTGLASASGALFLVQTPPARWGVAACDALAVNLMAGLVVAGLGLVLAARLTRGRGRAARLAAVASAGLAAALVYIALDPGCLRGVFTEVDPRVRPFWFDHVSELAPIWRVFARRPADALGLGLSALAGGLAWAGLVWTRRGKGGLDFGLGLVGACLVAALVLGALAERMSIYALWFAVPPVAAALAELRAWAWRCGWRTRAQAGALAVVASGAGAVLATLGPARLADLMADPPDPCFATAAWSTLAAQPAGLTLGEIDLGSYVLAQSPSSALSAPYHRMDWGILAARSALAAPVDLARAKVEALHVRYVLACPAHRRRVDRVGLVPDALQRRLDSGRPPAWLTPLSPPGAPLQLYRVQAVD